MKIAEYQNKIIKQILLIDDETKLNEISKLIKKIAPKVKLLKVQSPEEEKDIMEFETFEDWDAYLQSIEYHDPDKFLPEWGMSSIEFRKFIWDSEHVGTITYSDFVEEVKSWQANEPKKDYS